MPVITPAVPLASAYPSPDLPAAQLAVMIVVPVGLLVVWIALVFLAAHSGTGRSQSRQQRDGKSAAVADQAHDDDAGVEPQLTRSRTLVS